MTPEGRIEKYLVDRVRATGGKIRKLKWIGRNGAPDRMVWWPTIGPSLGRVCFVELKAPGKKPTREQKEEHKKMRDDGLLVFVFDSADKIDEFIYGQTWSGSLTL